MRRDGLNVIMYIDVHCATGCEQTVDVCVWCDMSACCERRNLRKTLIFWALLLLSPTRKTREVPAAQLSG
jgi:hypothetical protein